ncbi:MAG TPA: hypothetical protein VGG89_07235 [Candidatus Baltobacteraceae bacterium]|jgi:hypothetical protein
MRLTAQQVAQMRSEIAHDQRSKLWMFPAGISAIAFLVLVSNVFFNDATGEGITMLFLFGGGIAAMLAYRAGGSDPQAVRNTLQAYDTAQRRWEWILERCDPNTVLETPLRLKPRETVYYAEPGFRLEERWTHQDIDTKTTTPNGFGAAVVGDLVAGPAGAVIGASIASRKTTGTATNVFNSVPVDTGLVIVTSLRFVFIGSRNTVEVADDSLLQELEPGDDDLLEVHYAQRAPGEAYTVDGDLFYACMARRANLDYEMPDPPEPLAEDYRQAMPAPPTALPK